MITQSKRAYPSSAENTRHIARIIDSNWNRKFPYSFAVVRKDLLMEGRELPLASKVAGLDTQGWGEFFLPFPPSDISIGTPFAITTTALNEGALEEHNGVVFRSIALSGTTGVLPDRGEPSNMANGGSVSRVAAAVGNTAAAASALFGLASPKPLRTGYQLLHELGNYLMAYAEAKKNPANKNLALLFRDRKDNLDYLVTPVFFNWRKSAGQPHLYQYSIQLKAVALAKSVTLVRRGLPGIYDASALQKAMEKLVLALQVLSGVQAIIKGVASDVDSVLRFVREGVLIAKMLLGLPITVMDTSAEIAGNVKNTIGRAYNLTEGLSEKHQRSRSNLDDVANQPWAWEDSVSPSMGAVSTSLQQQLAEELARVQAYSFAYLMGTVASLKETRDALSDAHGLGDSTYNEAANRTATPLATIQSVDDAMAALNALNDSIDGLTAVALAIRERDLSDPYARINSKLPDDARLVKPTAMLPVPFPHGGSLERLAQQYLGSADRWMEIVALNNLKAPYIDENGFDLAFLTSGNGNTFQVEAHPDLAVGQKAIISSDTIKQSTRTIVRLERTAADDYLVEVDGDPVDTYLVSDHATLHAWKPNTVHSSAIIYIPSNGMAASVPPDSSVTASLSRAEKQMGVDLLLTDEGDLSVAPNGLANLATGYTNALQAVKLKIGLEQGELAHHPEVGSGLTVGSVQSKLTAEELKSQVEASILSDDRFDHIENLSVEFNGPKVTLNIDVAPKGGGLLVPLSFAF